MRFSSSFRVFRGRSSITKDRPRSALATQKGVPAIARCDCMRHAKNLEPNTTYQVHVVGAPGPFTVAGIETFKIVDVTTNGGGILHVKGIDLEFATPGEYRVDVIVTQDGYVAGSVTNAELYMVAAANNLDVLLACQPAFTVTVE